jgi:hypothetical protein
MKTWFKVNLILLALALMLATGLSASESNSAGITVSIKEHVTSSVASVSTPVFSGSYSVIGYPAWVKNGTFRDTAYTIENIGDENLTYTVAKFESTGPAGWLTFSGFSGLVPFGVGNTETGQFRLNALASGTAGQTAQYVGGVVFTSNAPSSPDTVKITILLVDTVVTPDWDTLYVTSAAKATNRKGLTVSNSGGFGNAGDGRVNLDFADWNDCDTGATVYLSDGSVVVGSAEGADTNMYYNIFQSEWLDETGLRPVKGSKPPKVKTCGTLNLTLAYSGIFTTADTNIAMEKTWYAPILSGTGTVDSSWMIQCLKVYNTSGATRSGVVIGEVADWNIPSDTGYLNSSNVNPIKKLIYQQGGEFDDAGECQDNNARFGAVRYLGGYKNAIALPADPVAAFTREISSDVVPTGTFVETNLFSNMQTAGYTASGSNTDLYTVMTFRKNETLTTTDTLRFYTAWLTVQNGDTTSLFTMSDRAASWFTAKSIASIRDTVCEACGSCCISRGNINHLGGTSVSDITYLVKFLFVPGSPPPPCPAEADVNGDGKINVADITYLVKYLFVGGPPPPPCPPCS